MLDYDNISDSDDELLGIGIPHSKTQKYTYYQHLTPSTTHNLQTPGWRIDKNLSLNIEHRNKLSTDFCSKESRECNKYQRLKETSNIQGYVVNVHDATNLDIDLVIPPELEDRYRQVITNYYTYHDLGEDINLPIDNLQLKRGRAFRCRLRGVGNNYLSLPSQNKKIAQLTIEIRQLIDRADGWVTCTLSDIDIYQRLLVDIIIRTPSSIYNLREFILNKMEKEEYPVYTNYTGKKKRE